MNSDLTDILAKFDAAAEGQSLHRFASELYPLCRSITGHGLRSSLDALKQFVPVDLHEVPSGTRVLDWTVPNEWNIRDAWIKDARGERVVDFRKSNLHVVNYSIPVRARLTLAELKPHLHSIPEHPDWIPYRTSYYHESWGFCLSHRPLEALPDAEYEVCIDSTLAPGALTFAEFRIQGDTDDEFLFSAHACHPSLANDNLSGIAVAARLAQILQGRRLRHSYRFLWAPGTIGAIAWLASRREQLGRIAGGLVLTCLGDPGVFHYKQSRQGRASIDSLVEFALAQSGSSHEIEPFAPTGYDERQFGSPGFNLPIGRLARTPNGRYAEYHTSADNLELIQPGALAESLRLLLQIVDLRENHHMLRNLAPYGEPQLGRRGLFRAPGDSTTNSDQAALLWVLNLSDGAHSLIDIATRSGLPLAALAAAADRLKQAGLLADADRTAAPVPETSGNGVSTPENSGS